MTAPRITRRWDASVVLTFPYSVWLVDTLKAEIPGHARTYDPLAKSWTITAAYASVAARLMHDVFPDVEVVDTAQAGPPFDRGSGTRDDPYIVLHLRPTAPPELVNAAHKVLAKLNHPDAGGDTITMQRINSAVEQIREVSR